MPFMAEAVDGGENSSHHKDHGRDEGLALPKGVEHPSASVVKEVAREKMEKRPAAVC